MFPRMILHIDTIGEHIRLRLAEYQLTVSLLLGGVVLLRGPTFDLAVYEVIRQIMGQSTLAFLMLSIGAARLAVLVINGRMERGSPHLRSGLASLSGMLWLVLLAGFISHHPPVLIVAFLASFVGTELAVAYRAAQDAGSEDKKYRESLGGKSSG